MSPMKPPKGGKVPGQGAEQNHLHASAMAHGAAGRLSMAKALQGKQQGAPGLSSAAPAPPAVPAQGAIAAPAQGGNYKMHVAKAVGAVGPTPPPAELHSAIDSLTAKGAFSPFQGAALKAHNGPLHGPQGAHTMHLIGTEILNRRGVGGGMGVSPRPPGVPRVPGGGMPPGGA